MPAILTTSGRSTGFTANKHFLTSRDQVITCLILNGAIRIAGMARSYIAILVLAHIPSQVE